MEIVQPYARIINPFEDNLQDLDKEFLSLNRYLELQILHCEYCARVSHRSEDRITHGSALKLLQFIVMNKGDFSVIEHGGFSVEFLVDRGITHEIVRHRLFSYTQESTRFVNYEKKMPPKFIEPYDSSDEGYVPQSTEILWHEAIDTAEEKYRELVRTGVPPQIARSVFPNALASKIVMTGNFRNWRHFLLMRTSKEAHPQMRQVTIPLLKELQELEPIAWLFNDIQPESSQAQNMRLMR